MSTSFEEGWASGADEMDGAGEMLPCDNGLPVVIGEGDFAGMSAMSLSGEGLVATGVFECIGLDLSAQ